MISLIKHYLSKYKDLVLYCIIGCSGALLDFIIYSVLTRGFGLHYQISNVISVSFGIINNFILNVKFNFKVSDHLFRRFLCFASIGIFGMSISAGLLYVFIDVFHIHELISKILIIGIVTVVQFTLNKIITFHKGKQ